MRITELQLIKFGKFSDYKIKIKDGFNVIYGENEAGKSTVLLFVKLMLYGVSPKRAKTGDLNERTRIIPWGESKAAGRIKMTDDNRRIEIYREFGKRASDDIVRVTDSDTGEDYLRDVQGEDVGERLLGMSRQMFESTLWIGQDDVCMRGKNDEITARLMNFLDSGSASDVSVNEALKQLERKELSIKARTKRNVKGEIDLLEEERDRLLSRLSDINRAYEKQQNNRERLTVLENNLKKIESETEYLRSIQKSELAKEKIKRVERLDSCLKREMQLANTRQFQVFKHKISDEIIDEIDKDYAKIDELEVLAYEQSEKLCECERIKDKREKTAVKNQILGAIFPFLTVIINVLCFGIGGNKKTLGFVLAGVFILLAAAYVVMLRVSNRKVIELSDEISDIASALENKRNEISETEQRLIKNLKEFECENYSDFKEKLRIYSEDKAKIKVCHDLYTEELKDDDYNELKKETDELKKSIINDSLDNDCESRLKQLNAEKDKILIEITELKQSQGADEEKFSAVDIKDEISEIDKQLEKKHRELKAVRLASECLSAAYAQIKSDFTPYLNRETMEILSELTSGSHENIKVSEDFSININNNGDSGDSKRAEFFSMGTYNQMYFALRLAIVRLTVPHDNRILYLDDLLMTYDDERSRKAIEMLEKICRTDNIQIILFTCHGRDVEYAAKYSEIITEIHK